MTMTTEPFARDADMALAALLSAATEVGQGISLDLLRKAYAIQRRHQFDQPEHRAASLQDLTTLIDEFIDAEELGA